MAFDAQKIKFLQGTSTKLAGLTTSEVGAFYVTNDTHELYLGVEANKAPVALNRWVDVVDSISAITTSDAYKKSGKLYYAKDTNILCTYKDGSWVQINPDTNTTLHEVEVSDGEKRDGAIAYTLTFKQTDKAGAAVQPDVTAELVITEDMVTSLVVDVKVNVTATVAEGVATVKTSGTGADGEGFTVKGQDGITIVADGTNGFIVDGTTYKLEAEGTNIQLRNSNNTGDDEKDIDGVVEFADDDKWIEVSNDNGKIKIAHIGNDSAAKTTGTATKLEDEDTFEVVTGLTIEKGHVTGYETTTYTVQDTITTVDGSIETKDEVKQLRLDTKDENDVVIETDYVDISSTLTVNGTDYTIEPTGKITLPEYYTKAEINAQNRALDAMVYKGVVNSENDLPTTAEIGWTYKVGTTGTYKGIECGVGDLLIANGTETDGQLINITWDHINTFNQDTTYTLNADDNKIIFHNNVSNDDTTITVTDDDVIILTAEENVLKAEHKLNNTSMPESDKPTHTTDLVHSGTFTVITGLSNDGYGHIDAIETTQFKLPASGDFIEVDADNVKMTFKDVAGDAQGSIDFKDDNVVTVEGASTDGKNLVATVKHATVTKNDDPNGTAAPAHGGTFTAVEAVTYNDYGHVTGVKTTTVTLPEETTYEIDGPTAVTNGVKYALKNNAGDDKGDPIEIVSDSLTVAISETKTTIDMVWGSF